MMKFGEHKKVDEALYIWLRELDHPVSKAILIENARILFQQFL